MTLAARRHSQSTGVPLWPIEDDALVLRAREDRLNDVRRQQRQLGDPADIVRTERLDGGDLGKQLLAPCVDLLLPAPSTSHLCRPGVRGGAPLHGRMLPPSEAGPDVRSP